MKPIYFPYTHVSPKTVDVLSLFFKKVIVYRPAQVPLPDPMQTGSNRNALEIRVPEQGDEQKVAGAAGEFQSWGGEHKDFGSLHTQFIQRRLAGVPFFTETAPSKIVADVKNKAISSSSADEPSFAFQQRVFLMLAQEYDSQNDELVSELGHLAQKTKEMTSELSGESAAEAAAADRDTTGLKIPQPTEFMIRQRLQAWPTLWLSDHAPAGFFITDSPAVLNEVLDNVPAAQKAFSGRRFGGMRDDPLQMGAWQEQLQAELAALMQKRWPVACEGLQRLFSSAPKSGAHPAVYFDVHIIPDTQAAAVFARLGRQPESSPQPARRPASFRNTLIILLGKEI